MYKKIVLYFGSECNWECEGCTNKLHPVTKYKSIDVIDEYLTFIRDNFSSDELGIVLSGGETGLISDELLDLVAERLNKFKLAVNTNGTFFTRLNKLKKFKNMFNKLEFLWHCVPTLTDEISQDLIDIVELSNLSDRKSIILTRSSFHLIDNFLNKYSEYSFFISPYFGFLKEEFLTEDNLNYLNLNYSNQILNMDELLENKYMDYKLCQKYPSFAKLDFVDFDFMTCSKLHTFTKKPTDPYIPYELNFDNLLKFKNGQLETIYPEEFCSICPKKTTKIIGE